MVGERLTQLEGEVQQLAPATPIDDLEAAKKNVDSKVELQVGSWRFFMKTPQTLKC